jgi:hypothetical protein
MKVLTSVLATAIIVGVIGTVPKGVMAAPITYDFAGTALGNQALGGSHTYTAAGGPDITAISGSFAQLGTVAPITGDAFTAGGQLVGNNRGNDGMGVGVCFNNGCNHGHIDDNPEIDASGREAVRLDITGLISSFNSFTIDADSATGGELLGIFAGDATGTILGAKLGDATSSDGNVSISPTGNFLFIVADNTTTSGADVLLHSLTVTPHAIPEPASLALLGSAILAVGLICRRHRKRDGTAETKLARIP